MGSSISGQLIVQVLKTFAETADPSQLAKLCQEVGLPTEPRESARYPVVLFNRLIDVGCQRFWPELTLQEGQYRQGARSVDLYVNTLLGKVSLTLSGGDIKRLASTAPEFYKAISTTGTVTFVDTGEKSYCLQFRGFESSPHFHHGSVAVFSGSLEPNAKLKMKILKLENPEPGVYLSDMDIDCELP